jgi:tetratricopeptide (TPR) repeat protein
VDATVNFEVERTSTLKIVADQPETSDKHLTLTEVETAIAQASHYADSGHVDAAEQAYVRADQLLGGERSPRHAEVLVCLALLWRKRGEVTAAARLLDEALAMFPGHRAALSQRLALAEEAKDWATASAVRLKMVELCESAEAQAHVLSAVVDDALALALAASLRALELRPNDESLRRRLKLLLEAS